MQAPRPLASFAADSRAAAALEFALILPVLILLLFGVVEIGNVLLLDKKVTAGAQTAADLVAQQKVVTSADLSNIWLAVDNIIAPFDANATTYRLLSIVADNNGATSIHWQSSRGGVGVASFPLPAGLTAANESVIVAVITYNYAPVFGALLFDAFDITDVAYLRPRTVERVELR